MDLQNLDLGRVIQQLIILILSITVHEFGHAWVADRLGDRLPRSQGRVTLNPMAHADPWGTIAFPGIFLLLSGGQSMGFGWGRPVMVSPISFSRRFSMRTGHMMVAAAGPAMNVLFGVFISLALWGLLKAGVLTTEHHLVPVLRMAILLNFILAFFNLIPSHPLDGGAVMAGLLPDRLARPFEEFTQKFGMFILMAFVFSPSLARIFVWPAVQLWRLWGEGVLGL